jgi:RNA 3'-terminal phosphate cyclase (ATP)
MVRQSKASSPIQLEGTTLEGGGQLLRIAIGLSSLTKTPIHITNIRGKRSGGGGLKAQHLTSVQWLARACNARLSGAGLKSKDIMFTPSATANGITEELETTDIRIKQTTPGSVNLVLQAILPYLLFSGAAQSPIRVRITGGTNVSNSPSVEYIAQVLVPMLELIGIPHIDTDIHSRGWSQGSTSLGSVTYTLTPLTSRMPAFKLVNRGTTREAISGDVLPQAFDPRHSYEAILGGLSLQLFPRTYTDSVLCR